MPIERGGRLVIDRSVGGTSAGESRKIISRQSLQPLPPGLPKAGDKSGVPLLSGVGDTLGTPHPRGKESYFVMQVRGSFGQGISREELPAGIAEQCRRMAWRWTMLLFDDGDGAAGGASKNPTRTHVSLASALRRPLTEFVDRTTLGSSKERSS